VILSDEHGDAEIFCRFIGAAAIGFITRHAESFCRNCRQQGGVTAASTPICGGQRLSQYAASLVAAAGWGGGQHSQLQPGSPSGCGVVGQQPGVRQHGTGGRPHTTCGRIQPYSLNGYAHAGFSLQQKSMAATLFG